MNIESQGAVDQDRSPRTPQKGAKGFQYFALGVCIGIGFALTAGGCAESRTEDVTARSDKAYHTLLGPGINSAALYLARNKQYQVPPEKKQAVVNGPRAAGETMNAGQTQLANRKEAVADKQYNDYINGGPMNHIHFVSMKAMHNAPQAVPQVKPNQADVNGPGVNGGQMSAGLKHVNRKQAPTITAGLMHAPYMAALGMKGMK